MQILDEKWFEFFFHMIIAKKVENEFDIFMLL
jgi:hypothetical protein